ncbi:MAG: dihydrofolate reductase, partial [Paludibacteraceae bacterium]|nr:dihydrofolate reductase [Paludibacteraceae bacterium]
MKKIIFTIAVAMSLVSCQKKNEEFNYVVDTFADMQILRYQVPEIDKLSTQQKELIYYLSEAALQGRDILYDQNGAYNLAIRRLFEAVYVNYNGDKENEDFVEFETYLKRVWVSNGIHHHYAGDKFEPKFSKHFIEKEINKLSDADWNKIGVSKNYV